jgi:3-hydroxyacyl-CoA dehydrogenase
MVERGDASAKVMNRLLVPYLMEAIRMIERGDASAKVNPSRNLI